MKHFNIAAENLEFKNLLSGPAPIGRILNYIYIAGSYGLYHKNGHRYLGLEDNIGSAWATEFMIGLGILSLGARVNDKYKLNLTHKGLILFELMKNNYQPFSEGVRSNDITTVRNEINSCNPKLYSAFKKIFAESLPFKILCNFLEEYSYQYDSKINFMNDFFEAVKNEYESTPSEYNRESRVPTAANRVPSLLQLMELFDFLLIDSNNLSFIKRNINTVKENIPVSADILIQKAEQENLIIKDAKELTEKYGEDGTVLVESIVRNGSLQKMFKHNLMISMNRKCVVCGISNSDLLVGSHIKPSALSTTEEKADYNNGFLLCCNHDKLFDHYLVTFDCLDGKIKISKTLSEEDKTKLGLSENFKLDESLLTEERKNYLKHHNQEFQLQEENR